MKKLLLVVVALVVVSAACSSASSEMELVGIRASTDTAVGDERFLFAVSQIDGKRRGSPDEDVTLVATSLDSPDIEIEADAVFVWVVPDAFGLYRADLPFDRAGLWEIDFDISTGERTAPFLIDALETFWAILYPDLFGTAWTPVSGTIPYRPSSGTFPACAGNTLDRAFYEGNAFYCAADDYVAWDDEVLFPDLYAQIGDFAIGLILANEWGRAVQSRAGLDIHTPAAQLQVDCLAGVWAAALVPEDNPMEILLSAGDLEEGIAGFLTLSATPGEDGAVSAFDRFESFKDGFFSGTDACGI